MKILNTERAILTLLKKNDFGDILKMFSEQNAFKYVKPFQNKDENFFIEFLNKKLAQNKSLNGIGVWVAKNIETDEFIGLVNLNPFANTEMIQLGCHLKQDFRKQGFATELTNRVLKYGIDEIGLKCIYGIIENENFASKRLMEKLDFVFEKSEIIFETKIEIYKCTV